MYCVKFKAIKMDTFFLVILRGWYQEFLPLESIHSSQGYIMNAVSHFWWKQSSWVTAAPSTWFQLRRMGELSLHRCNFSLQPSRTVSSSRESLITFHTFVCSSNTPSLTWISGRRPGCFVSPTNCLDFMSSGTPRLKRTCSEKTDREPPSTGLRQSQFSSFPSKVRIHRAVI